MFTGIVRATGLVLESGDNRLRIEYRSGAPGLKVGGSVAINGCCLTVTASDGASFVADVVPETLRRTNLGRLDAGARVNLELPLTLETPLDGHLVQGHVDGTGRILQVREVSSGRELTCSLPSELSEFVAEKGSIAVDGMSLTVAAVADDRFAFALIPHTLAVTIAGGYQTGTEVNLEVDLLARYVNRIARAGIK